MESVLRFLFKGELGRQDVIRRGGALQSEQGKTIEALRFKLVSLFSWVLSIVLILSVLGILGLVAAKRDVPGFLPAIITGVIGYFGGAIAAFFGIRGK